MKYKDSGVNIDHANRAKAAIAAHVKSTWGEEVLSDTGAFGGLFALGRGYDDPVLVSSVDGVGTKVIVAKMAGRFDTVGRDLVNHCVNDILVQGARPLFFLDYFASGRLEPERLEAVVAGVATACRENGCALIGGETAEMPGVYGEEDFDLAGCVVGVVDRGAIIDGSKIAPGDAVLALPASGLHTNGYSLARRIVFDTLKLGVGDRIDALGRTAGEALLDMHRSYLGPVRAMMERVTVKGLAHITGGGVVENLPRILPAACDARIEKGTWTVPPVFTFLQEKGGVDEGEMYRVFNMGIGMAVIVDAAERDAALEAGAPASVIGKIVAGRRQVVFAAP